MRAYEFRHVVGFAETNLTGNVYYVNHLAWQGRCRELFLKENAPEIIAELANDLRMVTTRCSCEYFAELTAFDEVIVRMRLSELTQNRLTLGFEYSRQGAGSEELVARGEQQVACLRRQGEALVPTPVPELLRTALKHFQ